MDDDLNTVAALAVRARRGPRRATPRWPPATTTGVRAALAAVRAMLDMLGLDPLDPHWSERGHDGELRGVVDALVALALEQRAAARARKDWAAADARARPAQAGRGRRRGHPAGSTLDDRRAETDAG